MIDIAILNNYISHQYKSPIAQQWIYQDQSLVFDYVIKQQRIAVSYNKLTNRTSFFLRDKPNEVAIYGYFLEKLNFIFKENMYVYQYDIADSYEVIVNSLIKILKGIDTFFIMFNQQKLDFIALNSALNQFVPITGNVQDSQRNVINAPLINVDSKVKFTGHNNQLTIHAQANIRDITFQFNGSNSSVTIGEHVSLTGLVVIGNGSTLTINKETTSTKSVYFAISSQVNVEVGEDCMFASDIQVRTDDSHPIYDVQNLKRINPSKDIKIGNHVWVGYGSFIFGGASIGDGSIIGANTIVKKKFPNNCVIAGAPAKVVRKNIAWERPFLPEAPDNIDELMLQTQQHHPRSYWQLTQDNCPEIQN